MIKNMISPHQLLADYLTTHTNKACEYVLARERAQNSKGFKTGETRKTEVHIL